MSLSEVILRNFVAFGTDYWSWKLESHL